MKSTTNANYCPECGEKVKKSYATTNIDKMRKAAADISNGCVKFYGMTTLGKNDAMDFSELGRQLKPVKAEVFIHENNQPLDGDT